MKLSDMIETLAAYSRELEDKSAQWQASAEKWASDYRQQAQAWYKDAEARMKQANAQFDEYVEDATDAAKAEWNKAEDVWASQMAEVQAKSEDLRNSLDGYGAAARAEASEAYAAAMSKFAIAVQNEAEKAVAFAAEAKGKSDE